jgi:hypothetical protein
MYEGDELDQLFSVCTEEERLWYEFFQMTEMREQEVMYTYWSDINFTATSASAICGPELDTECVQRTRDSDSGETRKEIESVEGKV